ncbi:MAG: leucine-rich repeat domain-containing protein [Mycoplasmoidaceae bacterium]|nr:leucine-rich repeat domain-containing protein [Mycoplasmoidaceae bacterium]
MIRGIALEDWDGQCSIEYIGDQAFAGCKFASEVANAVTINFPKSVKTIGQASFAAINDLKRVTFDRLDNGSRIFGAGAFMGDKNLELPSFADACVTQVPEYAFSGCNHLTTDGDFTLDGCITNIGSNAFEDSGLKNIVLQPDTTLTIESNAFDSNALETIDIGGISDFNCLTLKDNAFPSTSGTITGFAGSAD